MNDRQHSSPKVSVIIPAYNQAEYLCQAIDSALSQTYNNVEIIVVDDGSTDNTQELVKKYTDKIHYIRQTNQGSSSARNRALTTATGKYIAFVDHDDIWLKNKLEEEVPFLENNKEYGFIYSGVDFIDENGRIIGQRTTYKGEEPTFDRLYKGPNIICSPTNTIVRRKCLEYAGGFDTDIKSSYDYDLWLRLSRKFKFTYFNKILSQYRFHRGNMHKDYEQRLRDHLIIFRKPELTHDKNWYQRRFRIADIYYHIADLYVEESQFLRAAQKYFLAVIVYPLVGFYHWPNKIKSVRHSFLYRILKAYLLIFICIWKHLRFKSYNSK